MNFSFKLYLLEVEKQQVLDFADLMDKKMKSGTPLTPAEIRPIEKDTTNQGLYSQQINQAKQNPRMGQQMVKNLRVAANRPEYAPKIKAAATVPHFVVDLQKDIKNLTGNMINSIKNLKAEDAQSIIDGKYKGPTNQFITNIIKYKNHPVVSQQLKLVASKKPEVGEESVQQSGQVGYSDFEKYERESQAIHAQKGILHEFDVIIQGYLSQKNAKPSLESISKFVKRIGLYLHDINAIFDALLKYHGLMDLAGLNLAIDLYERIMNNNIHGPAVTELKTKIFNHINDYKSRYEKDKEFAFRFNKIQNDLKLITQIQGRQ